MRSILTALHEGRLFELPEAGKDRALEFLARIVDAKPDLEAGFDAVESVKQREAEGNTGIGLGIAVPHIRSRREDGDLFCAIGWSQRGLEYGAADGRPVHLVFMYYIPGALKSVYLKEISVLVKAVKKGGGIDPIEQAPDLVTVRNLLLDWVSAGLGDVAPEAVARMIRLEVKQAQAAVAPASEPIALAGNAVSRVFAFMVLTAPPAGAFVLATDGDWAAAVEKEGNMSARLAKGVPFVSGGRQVFVTGTATYPGGRTLYQCVAIATEPPKT